MTDFLYLAAGLLILIKCADLMVAGSVSVARKLGVSTLVIGLTVVSFGTSLPEMLVSVNAGLDGNADLAISNIVGSNIANVLLVLGLAAIIRPLPVQNSTVVSEIPFSLTAALLLGFLANAAIFSSVPELSISRLDGAILLFFFFLFLLYIYRTSAVDNLVAELPAEQLSRAREVTYILLGVVGLYVGGQLVVDGAVSVATTLGVDDVVIGLTIVAIGTSAPELVASGVAAYRGQTDVAVGNVVGSNIFNILWVVGLTSSLTELPFDLVSNTDLAIVAGSSALILVSLAISRTNSILRWHGAAFVSLYGVYLAYVVARG
ncbi:MAG: calcium/sodium antiporter [Pseudomonadales bacterium]|jgi:cation:H+ antiporter|nr:calcium/sodium antiporter [Pseudomonadales bacterium]MDP5058548.1 calcium/sodium antiporter [Pseudomonadales bacterium]